MSRPTDKAAEAWAVYGPKVEALLTRIGKEAADIGWETDGPFDLSDEEYATALLLTKQGRERVDVSLYLTEEKCREGEGDGLAFLLSIVEEGGRILGTFAPGNYSDALWTRTSEELEERWEMFERIEGTNESIEEADNAD